MTLILFLAVLTAVVMLVALPLLRPDEVVLPLAAEAPAGPEVEVDRVLSALSEIEYDFQMNKLSRRDYEELHARYSRQAIALVQEMESAGAGGLDTDWSDEPDDLAGYDLEAEAEAEAEAEIAALLEAGEASETEVKRS